MTYSITQPEIQHLFKTVLGFNEANHIWQASIYFGVYDMKSFLFLQPNDLFQTYVSVSTNDPPVTSDSIIQVVDARRIITLLSWLKTLQPLDPTFIFHLTATAYYDYHLSTLLPTVPVPTIPVVPKPLPTFGSHLKINLSDYP